MFKYIFLVPLVVFAQLAAAQTVSTGEKDMPRQFSGLFSKNEKVDTKFFPSDSVWVPRATYLLRNMKGFLPAAQTLAEDRYGGMPGSEKFKNTGFFYTLKSAGRWWIIDPEGNKWYCKAIVAVSPNSSARGKQVLQDSFKTVDNWGEKASAQVKSLGFNACGAWSALQNVKLRPESKVVYTVVLDIMSAFGYQKNTASQGTGHTAFKDNLMPVFDPAFQSFAEKHVADKVSGYKNDPWLLGYFSDNELNFVNDALPRFLKLPETDENYKAAKKWALETKIDLLAITKADQARFLEYYVETYYKIVSAAIKSADPDHLFLSSRLHGPDKTRPVMFKIAGKYSDIVSYNYYKSWYPEKEATDMWEAQAGKPFMITEWYAKGMDSGMKNETGWGWTVKSQEDRGMFYQNFALALLANKNCVGWHWFKYMDNDPTGKADPSNLDSNKGIVTWDYKPYHALMDSMRELNRNIYPLIKYFDSNL